MSQVSRPIRPQFSAIEKDYCLKITNKLINHDLTLSFRQPVDPERDRAPGYRTIIHHPMDLGTLKSKLENNEYRNSSEWSHDLILIWTNAITYNQKTKNYLFLLAKILLAKSEKYIKMIPKTETDLWYNRLRKAAEKVEKELNKNTRSSKSKK